MYQHLSSVCEFTKAETGGQVDYTCTIMFKGKIYLFFGVHL
jgi:hypothetical protein